MNVTDPGAQSQKNSFQPPLYSEKYDGDTVIIGEEPEATKIEVLIVASTTNQAGQLDPGPVVNDQSAHLSGRQLALVFLG